MWVKRIYICTHKTVRYVYRIIYWLGAKETCIEYTRMDSQLYIQTYVEETRKGRGGNVLVRKPWNFVCKRVAHTYKGCRHFGDIKTHSLNRLHGHSKNVPLVMRVKVRVVCLCVCKWVREKKRDTERGSEWTRGRNRWGCEMNEKVKRSPEFHPATYGWVSVFLKKYALLRCIYDDTPEVWVIGKA